MREVIWLHIGQAGVQIGNACWELFCLEHGIQPDWKKAQGQDAPHSSSQPFFSETESGKYVPRCVYIDVDPTTIDQIRSNAYKDLFDSKNLISGKEDSSQNFTRGHCTIGRKYTDELQNRIRITADRCQNLSGFMITNSISGDTGSGMGSRLLANIMCDYNQKTNVGLVVFPSPNLANSVVQPYNYVLSAHYLKENQDLTIPFNNEALYHISARYLGKESPNYTDINRIIAQVASDMTVAFRFEGAQNTTVNQLMTNVVPYRHLHFRSASHSPFVNKEKEYFENSSVAEMTAAAFESESQMTKFDPRSGLYMECSLSYRGDLLPSEVHSAVSEIRSKSTVNFTDWCPTGFRVSLNDRRPTTVKSQAKVTRSCTLLTNNTSLVSIFSKSNHKFDIMYSRRAFVHWFVREGCEVVQFEEAREALALLEKDYEEAGLRTGEELQIDVVE